jgi:mortality factor 4-like protein 1
MLLCGLFYRCRGLSWIAWIPSTAFAGFSIPSELITPGFYTSNEPGQYRWDEWVPSRRLMKYSDEKVVLQKRMAAEQKAEQNASAASAKASKTGSGAGGSGGVSASVSGGGRGASGVGAGRKEGGRGTKRARDDVRCPPPLSSLSFDDLKLTSLWV